LIIEFVRYFVSLAGMAVLWYILDSMTIDFINTQVAKYPTMYPTATVTFVKSLTHWFILLVLIGLTYSLLVAAQRTRSEGYY